MMWELSEMWFNDEKSAFTKRIYKLWNCEKLSFIMLSKITTTWYHSLAVGRGRLNSQLAKWNPEVNPNCRFGCLCVETPEHVFLRCPYLLNERKKEYLVY